jgi:hypothetical protein
MVQNGIPRVCFFFCSTERNSKLFSLPQNGSKQNSESLPLFLFHRTEFRVVFSFAEGFQEFAFCFMEQNSELFSLLRKDSKRNSESILFHRTAGIRILKSLEHLKNLKTGRGPYSGLKLTMHVIKSQIHVVRQSL